MAAVHLTQSTQGRNGKSYSYWRLIWRDGSGKSHCKTVGSTKKYSRRQAEKLRRDQEHELRRLIEETKNEDGLIYCTVEALITRYLKRCATYYRESNEEQNVRYGVEHLKKAHPHLPANDLTPMLLKKLRYKMIARKKPNGKQQYARSTINKHIAMIGRMYKWAASEGIVSTNCYLALTTVDGLRAGRSDARETKPVVPVPEVYIERILPYTSEVVGDMIRLQDLTGMRSSELCSMRPVDIDTTGSIWQYKPTHHKTKWRGRDRVIPIGPKAQNILRPYLSRMVKAYCFTPKESYPQNAENMKDKYEKDTYYHAVKYAIAAARKAGIEVIDFHPHQLRHNAATRIRKELGLDAARAVLGQSSLQMAGEYAEIDLSKAVEAACKVG